MSQENPLALSIWNNIEKTYGERLDFHYEGNQLVGIHGIDQKENAIDYIDNLRSQLARYQDKLEELYGLKKVKKISGIISVKLSYVYLMLNERDGLYKIGRSLNPCYREKTLQSDVPQVVKVFTSQLTYQANETKLHRLFKEKRVRGEWFRLNEEDIEYIKNYNYGVD